MTSALRQQEDRNWKKYLTNHTPDDAAWIRWLQNPRNITVDNEAQSVEGWVGMAATLAPDEMGVYAKVGLFVYRSAKEIVKTQQSGGVAAFIDCTHDVGTDHLRHRGIKVEELLISQPDTTAQGWEIALTLLKSGSVDLVVFVGAQWTATMRLHG